MLVEVFVSLVEERTERLHKWQGILCRCNKALEFMNCAPIIGGVQLLECGSLTVLGLFFLLDNS